MGPSRSGPRGGTGPWGQYKTPDMLGSIRAQRGRARSALFSPVMSIGKSGAWGQLSVITLGKPRKISVTLGKLSVGCRSYESMYFPWNKIPGQKISRQNIAGRNIWGPENSRNTNLSWNLRNYFWRKFQDFISNRAENSRIFDST